MHLDRDDVGQIKDQVRNKNGKIIRVEQNQETVTVRGFISGQYIVNVMLYSKLPSDSHPIPVTVQVLKINPFGVVHEETIILRSRGEERTISRFFLDNDGLVIRKSKQSKSLIRKFRRPNLAAPLNWPNGERRYR